MSNELVASMETTIQSMADIVMIVVLMGVALFIIIWFLSKMSR
jgi:hypothetical protein